MEGRQKENKKRGTHSKMENSKNLRNYDRARLVHPYIYMVNKPCVVATGTRLLLQKTCTILGLSLSVHTSFNGDFMTLYIVNFVDMTMREKVGVLWDVRKVPSQRNSSNTII